jgi:hypothetical protein
LLHWCKHPYCPYQLPPPPPLSSKNLKTDDSSPLARTAKPILTFRANLSNTTTLIPNTTWDSISSFTWIGNWETLEPAAVAKLNISGRYPFLRYAELFTATGGCTQGFVDTKYNKTCEPWLDFDAPKLASGAYDWSRLLHAVDNVRAADLHPYLVTGNVPVSMSSGASLGGFGVNTKLPDNLAEYSLYIKSFAAAALAKYGAAEMWQWKWGVLTEYNNREWFEDDGPTGYFKLYDHTVAGLRSALGKDGVGAVGAHACTTCGAPTYPKTGWSGLELIKHVTAGKNYATGATGSQFDFWADSFYAAVPEGSDPGHIPPWSIGNFEDVMGPLRATLDAAGLEKLPLGIDEGRILAGPGGTVQLGGARALGSVYMAAFDALMFHKMLEGGVSWYSRWAVNTNGQSIASSVPALDSTSTQTARLTYRMAGHARAPVQSSVDAGKINWSTARDTDGPKPGPQLGNISLVDVVVGVDTSKAMARVLVSHFSGSLNATETASPSIQLCGLTPSVSPSIALYTVDESHSTYWSAWVSDVVAHTGQPYGSVHPELSWYDETAPRVVLDKRLPGFEWLSQRWSAYEAMTILAPTEASLSVDAQGCATLQPTLAAHAVLLYEIPLRPERRPSKTDETSPHAPFTPAVDVWRYMEEATPWGAAGCRRPRHAFRRRLVYCVWRITNEIYQAASE